MNKPDDDIIWAGSEIQSDGSYAVTLTLGPDLAWTLDEGRATRYLLACLSWATEAEHMAAVFQQLREALGLSKESAGAMMVHDVIVEHPERDEATEPLRFRVALGTRRSDQAVVPVITVKLNGKEIEQQFTVADMRHHALSVLTAMGGHPRRAVPGAAGGQDQG